MKEELADMIGHLGVRRRINNGVNERGVMKMVKYKR
jgi:hypothetical protein